MIGSIKGHQHRDIMDEIHTSQRKQDKRCRRTWMRTMGALPIIFVISHSEL